MKRPVALFVCTLALIAVMVAKAQITTTSSVSMPVMNMVGTRRQSMRNGRHSPRAGEIYRPRSSRARLSRRPHPPGSVGESNLGIATAAE